VDYVIDGKVLDQSSTFMQSGFSLSDVRPCCPFRRCLY